MTIIGTRLAPVDDATPCDRCSHPAKYHAGPDRGSVCMIAGGRVWHGALEKRPRATKCWCDGFVPKESA